MKKEDLNKILDDHRNWLKDETDGLRADLRLANLVGADLRCMDLVGADLRSADLRDANLVGANLSYTNLDDHIICLDRIGSAKRKTTYNATKDIVWCGCFTGTFAQWCDKIKNEYPKDNVYRKEYEAAIAYFKTIVDANKKGK